MGGDIATPVTEITLEVKKYTYINCWSMKYIYGISGLEANQIPSNCSNSNTFQTSTSQFLTDMTLQWGEG